MQFGCEIVQAGHLIENEHLNVIQLNGKSKGPPLALSIQECGGIGKTVISLATAAWLFEDDLVDHVIVVADGRLCGCGRAGHLEAYAGRAGIEAEARRRVAAGSVARLVVVVMRGS